MITVTDARGTEICLPRPPQRIVSLVPSTTESVYTLGAGDRLVGVTRYCVLPPEAQESATVVGGTKSPRIDEIHRLKPDLVLANQEENQEQDVDELRTAAPVYVAFPRDLVSAIEELRTLGVLLGCEKASRRLVEQIDEARTKLKRESLDRPPFRFVYLIWRTPFMAAGAPTFIDGFLREAGGRNALDPESGRYPQLTVAEIEDLQPDVVFFSSEPFPFESVHVTEFLETADDPSFLKEKCLLVDGQLLSWHGSRLRDGIPYLAKLARQIGAPGAES